eukprot:g6644.t1
MVLSSVAGSALPEITDEVAERLFRSLEMMEADYQRTLAAERDVDEEEDLGAAGYAALGSDDGGSDEDEEVPAGDSDWGNFQTGEDVWANSTAAPESELESFADFGDSNPALPAPPEMSLLQAKLLSRDEVQLIKETMQQIQLPTPSWAQRLSDRDFQRLVQESIRSGA